jgi:hypothetical protein
MKLKSVYGNTAMNDLSEIFKPIFNFAGVIIALLIALRIFLLWWNSPSQKGKRGERLVAMRLKKAITLYVLTVGVKWCFERAGRMELPFMAAKHIQSVAEL